MASPWRLSTPPNHWSSLHVSCSQLIRSALSFYDSRIIHKDRISSILISTMHLYSFFDALFRNTNVDDMHLRGLRFLNHSATSSRSSTSLLRWRGRVGRRGCSFRNVVRWVDCVRASLIGFQDHTLSYSRNALLFHISTPFHTLPPFLFHCSSCNLPHPPLPLARLSTSCWCLRLTPTSSTPPPTTRTPSTTTPPSLPTLPHQTFQVLLLLLLLLVWGDDDEKSERVKERERKK